MVREEPRPEGRGQNTRGVERTITLTDAVVAIAMTLLVLPLIDLVPEADQQGLGHLLGTHRDDFLGFALSFVVIYRFWSAHEAAFAQVERTTPVLRFLNMLWLLMVAFLPFPTALVGRHDTTTTTPVYLGTMFVLSAVTVAMGEAARRTRPAAEERSRPGWRRLQAWAPTVVFAGCTALSTVNPNAGLFGLLLLAGIPGSGPREPAVRGGEDPTAP